MDVDLLNEFIQIQSRFAALMHFQFGILKVLQHELRFTVDGRRQFYELFEEMEKEAKQIIEKSEELISKAQKNGK